MTVFAQSAIARLSSPPALPNKLSLLFVFVVIFSSTAKSQESQGNSRLASWLELQAVPSLGLTSRADQSAFCFEWEATPLLYSFGMTRLVSPWYSFIVEPPARFTGSLELVVTGQANAKKIGSSYFAGSLQLLGHIPLIERGENLSLNLGVGQYYYGKSSSVYAVAGISTLFGIVHLNLKHGSQPTSWIGSLEFRLF
ncbi:MAG: hypothetical protein AABZ02_02330 [Bacteroidota bacterium]